ncbi:hypothetical protein [Phyllobacterium brassicacearum]|nr:hypothetical protein [Phyllobacterium brassicacearum]
MPQLFDGFRRSGFDGANPKPVQASKQGLELAWLNVIKPSR